VSSLRVANAHGERWRELVCDAPLEAPSLDDEARRALSARFVALGTASQRRLDAWSVERAERQGPFAWSAATSRRTLGNAALRRLVQAPLPVLDAVQEVVTDRLLAAAAGFARAGSLGHWLAGLADAERCVVIAEAANWTTTLLELTHEIDVAWRPVASDAYYVVAGARTTLRAQREIVIEGPTRVIVRMRAGAPGRSAGAGLRADLAVETLAHPHGDAPGRFIGVWPDAGIALGVDGTLEDVRAGARHLLRAARGEPASALESAA
jgi:hypothetical protein